MLLNHERARKIITFVIIISLVIFVYLNRQYLNEAPFETRYCFSAPHWASSDQNGYIYVVDKLCKRLTKIRPDGEVQWFLTGARRDDTFLNLRDFRVDGDGNVYIINGVDDLKSTVFAYSEVLKFDSRGRFVKKLARYNSNMSCFSMIRSPQPDRFFYCPIGTPRSSEEINLYSLSTKDGQDSHICKVDCQYSSFRGLIGYYPDKILLPLLDGPVCRLSAGGSAEVCFRYGLTPYPDEIWPGPDYRFYYVSYDDMNIYRIDDGGSSEVYISRAKMRDAIGRDNFFLQGIAPSENGDLVMVDRFLTAGHAGYDVLVFGADGRLKTILREGFYNARHYRFRLAVWGAAMAVLALFLYYSFYFYYLVATKKTSIIIQDIATFTPLLVICILLTATSIYNYIYPKMEEQFNQRLIAMAHSGSLIINAGDIENVKTRMDFNSRNYLNLHEQMDKILNDNKDEWNVKFTICIYKMKNGILHMLCDSQYNFSVMEPYPYTTMQHYDSYRTGRTGIANYADQYGEYRVGLAPVKNHRGETIALLEIVADYSNLKELDEMFVTSLIKGIVATLAFYFSILSLLSYFMLVSIRVLRNIVKKITAGDLDVNVDLGRSDELGDLGRGINYMTGSLREYFEKIMLLNASYFRFVPRNFLELLQKDSVVNVNLGDNIKKDMAVLFSDIRAFTTLSEKLTPQENFNFINSYLRQMGPVIRENSGFIDKYIGDAIMALFESPDSAVKCTIAMAEKLSEYNAQRKNSGYEPISIGIGLHYGQLMLGIVGERERINATVISDSVGTASHLESLCKQYGALIIVSGNILEQIKDPAGLNVRPLGKVTLSGKRSCVELNEIIVPGIDETSRLKSASREKFAGGVGLYSKGRISEALEIFKKINEENCCDKAAALFKARCEKLLKTKVPDGFNGIDELIEK